MEFDSVVVGGGLVGVSLGLAMAQKGTKVCLVDAGLQPASTALDGRTLALAQGSRQILVSLGLWEALKDHAHSIEEIRISQPKSKGFVHYKSKDVGPDPMGYLIPLMHLQKALEDKIQEEPNVTLTRPFKVQTLENHAHHVSLTSDTGQTIHTKLCFAADGKQSWIRSHLGMRTKKWPYDQTGIVTTVRHEKPHNQVAFEHFLPRGPLAFLPLKEYESAIVWTEETAAASYLMGLDDQGFESLLQESFPHLGALTLTSPRQSYPLSGHFVPSPTKGRTFLVGDAAHGIHPVAGQGFNLGLRDVAWFLQQPSHVFTDLSLLTKRYTRHRRFDVWSMTALTHGLVKLFSHPSSTLSHIRGLGMELTNHLPFMKRLLTRHAMGMMGGSREH